MISTMGSDRVADSNAQVGSVLAPSEFFHASVLVVDDHEDTRFLLRTLLEKRGANVVEAANGEMAIALAANMRLDLILMDSSLPLLDGLEATRRIRRLSSSSEVPIVFLSGHAQPGALAQALAAGCNDYLTKPIDFDAWDRMLQQHLPDQRSQSAQ